MAWSCPLTFDPKEPLCTRVESPKILPLCVPAMIIPLRCSQRQRLAIYPVSAVSSISEGKQQTGCKLLSWSPPVPYFRKRKVEAD